MAALGWWAGVRAKARSTAVRFSPVAATLIAVSVLLSVAVYVSRAPGVPTGQLVEAALLAIGGCLLPLLIWLSISWRPRTSILSGVAWVCALAPVPFYALFLYLFVSIAAQCAPTLDCP
jgi:hypothetical protein